MYLYLGQDTVIRSDEVVGIFDLENTSMSRITKGYLRAVQRTGQVIAVSDDLPRSYVVCEKEGKRTVYLTQISPSTLRKRAITGIRGLGSYHLGSTMLG